MNLILIGEFREDEKSVSQESQDMAGQMFMVPGKAWFTIFCYLTFVKLLFNFLLIICIL